MSFKTGTMRLGKVLNQYVSVATSRGKVSGKLNFGKCPGKLIIS